MIKYNIGDSKIKIRDRTVKLKEPVQKVEVFNNEVVVLFYRGIGQIEFEPLNNIHVYNIETGEKVWGIEELIRKNQKCKQFNITDEFYSEIRLEKDILVAIGFYWIINIDMNEKVIININPHR